MPHWSACVGGSEKSTGRRDQKLPKQSRLWRRCSPKMRKSGKNVVCHLVLPMAKMQYPLLVLLVYQMQARTTPRQRIALVPQWTSANPLDGMLLEVLDKVRRWGQNRMPTMAEIHEPATIPLLLLTRIPVLALLSGEPVMGVPIPHMLWALAIPAILVHRPRKSRRCGSHLSKVLRHQTMTALAATACHLCRLTLPQLLVLVVQTAWIREFTASIRTILKKTKLQLLALFDHGISSVKKWGVPGTTLCIYVPS